VADHPAQHPAGDRHHHAGQRRGQPPADPYCGAQRRGQEARHVRCERGERVGTDPQVLGPDHAVHEADRERQPVGVAQQAGELRGRAAHRDRRGLVQPPAHERDGLLSEIGVGGPREIGHGASVRPSSVQEKRPFVTSTLQSR
jgi:hypothetical protein